MSGAVIALFLVLLVVGFDVGFGMIATTYLSILMGDRMVNGTILPLQIVGGIDKYVLVAIPLFILTGEIMNRGGLTQRLVDWALSLVGHVRGALAQVSLLTNLMMAGVSAPAPPTPPPPAASSCPPCAARAITKAMPARSSPPAPCSARSSRPPCR